MIVRCPVSSSKWILAILLTASGSVSVPAQEPTPQDIEKTISYLEQTGKVTQWISKRVGPSVVHIRSKRKLSVLNRSMVVKESGSGVVVQLPGRKQPYLITNGHVVNGVSPSDLTIMMADGRAIEAKKVWTDVWSDVAVIELSDGDIPAAQLGDSSGLHIGSWVLAIGSPFDLAGSVTMGIVSGKGRRSLTLRSQGEPILNQDFIQTDAAINPGNSGGPLVNLRGEIVGINTAIASQSGSNEGVGFSIPINLVRQIASELIETGRVRRAFLGIWFHESPLTPSTAIKLGLERVRGAWVRSIIAGTPAEDAKLLPMDVIIRFDGRTVEDKDHLTNMVSMTPVGQQVDVVLWRDRSEKNVRVKLVDRVELMSRIEELNPAPPDGEMVGDLGIIVRVISDDDRRQFGYRSDQQGLLVVDFAPGATAAESLELYDVIDQIERTPVHSVTELRSMLSRVNVAQGALVRIARPTRRGVHNTQVVLTP